MPQVYRAIRPMFKTNRWRVCRDDLVYILSGPDKGKTGKVLEIFKDRRVPQVIVEGRNMRKKKVQTGSNPDDFFVVTMEAPLHYSQVQVVDPQTAKPVRVVYMYTPEGDKVRVRKVASPTINDILPTPSEEEPDPRAGLVGQKDTAAALARRGSYTPAAGFPFRLRNLERIWADLHPDASPQGDDGDAASSSSRSNTSTIRSGGGALRAATGGPRAFCTAGAGREAVEAVEQGRKAEEAGGAAFAAALSSSFALSGLRLRGLWWGAGGTAGGAGLWAALGSGAGFRRGVPGLDV